MKKSRFALLALGVLAATLAFTPSSTSKKESAITFYAFNSAGVYMGSSVDSVELKNLLCPGANRVLCAQLWSAKTPDNQPDGFFIANIKKP